MYTTNGEIKTKGFRFHLSQEYEFVEESYFLMQS